LRGLGLDAVAPSLAFRAMHTRPKADKASRQSTERALRLPAEWEPVGAVLLAWPSAESDWNPWLGLARATVAAMVDAIVPQAKVILLTDDVESLSDLRTRCGNRLRVVEQPMNDTWTRDYGPITVLEAGQPRLLDFGFNGWGLKFPADQDNRATARLQAAGCFAAVERVVPGLWLEGGSIESDGAGTILTTSACLLSPNRNPHLDRSAVEGELQRWLGAERVLWLDHGHLEGDDTDAHIDTIARLCPNDTIAYIRCDDPADSHHADFQVMEDELKLLRSAAGEPYRLVPLPWAQERRAADGHRLPATYANYLVVNGAVLVPTYADPARDIAALKAVGEAYPGYDVVGIDCTVLVEQHGSLHCMTMQIPEEVWTWTT
jgi:agmatine deiminase